MEKISNLRKKTILTTIIGLLTLSMFFTTAPAALAQEQPTLTLSLPSGPPGTLIAITGENFPYGTYMVWFDKNGDGRYDYGEPYSRVNVGAEGTFTTTLIIPSVVSGWYYIRAAAPPYTTPIASKEFEVRTVWEGVVIIYHTLTGILNTIKDMLNEMLNMFIGWFGGGGTYSRTTQIEAGSGRLVSSRTGTEISLGRFVASNTAQFTVTIYVAAGDAGDKAYVRATFDGTNWVTLDQAAPYSYLTMTIAAKGVEILYDDAEPANVIIDGGIAIIHAPNVTIEWIPP